VERDSRGTHVLPNGPLGVASPADTPEPGTDVGLMLRQMEVLMKKLAPLAANVPGQPGNADVRNRDTGYRMPDASDTTRRPDVTGSEKSKACCRNVGDEIPRLPQSARNDMSSGFSAVLCGVIPSKARDLDFGKRPSSPATSGIRDPAPAPQRAAGSAAGAGINSAQRSAA